jgi:hypothetical protein
VIRTIGNVPAFALNKEDSYSRFIALMKLGSNREHSTAPAKPGSAAATQRLALQSGIGAPVLRIPANVPTDSGLSCPLAHEVMLRG